MFVLKRIIESGRSDFSVDIFEKKNQLGAGMPYSDEGARPEHHIADLISPDLKAKYRLVFDKGANLADDKIHLGYFKLDKIYRGL